MDRRRRRSCHTASFIGGASIVTGHGSRTLVIGDSWAAGHGLWDIGRSFPAYLPGRVHVAAFSGSGFSEGATRCAHESYADRATWSPPPYNEIAFTARTGPGFDIKILSIATGETRQITFGEGSNESPAWAPNGRHLAFMSTRAGRSQIFTVDKDGRNLRQITKDGNNTTPNWSQ